MENSEDETDHDDKSHPVEETGFEFRHYESEAEVEEEPSNSNISPEELEMLQLPTDPKKGKKKYPYIRRDCK